jgi:hypothetical protein
VAVLAISGLDNYVLPHPMNLLRHPASRATPHSGSGSDGNYMGNDFRAAYAPGVSLTGTGQSVGLVEFDGYYASDITSYENQSSLSNVPLTNVLVAGFSGSPDNDSDAITEVSLDIEMAVAMAPGLSQVLVYEAPDEDNTSIANDILNQIATEDKAKEIGCSWGFSINASTQQTFQQFGAQGQSFFLASGDTGAFSASSGGVSPPSDDPYITIVGGTTLTTSGPGGSWVSETTWNWQSTGEGTGASSGGISTTYAIPVWQQGIDMSASQGSTTMRNLPDVAMVADNVWVIYGNGQSESVGGTSIATPLWAAFTALVNEQSAAAGNTNIGFINPAIYALAKSSAYPSIFHDITTGNNTNSASPDLFYAVTGYDLCTGWGTPTGADLINALSPVNSPLVVSAGSTLVAESCVPANGVIDPGETVTVNFSLQNISPVSTTNLVVTLLASTDIQSPTGPQTFGALNSGNGIVTKPFNFIAGGSCGQTIVATLQLQDGTNNLGTINYTFPLGTFVTATTFSENFDSLTAPALPAGWTTTASGGQSNWVTSTALYDTAPNSALAGDPTNSGITYLMTPAISIASASARLTFRQNYNLEAETSRHGTIEDSFDGGVLEIQIGGGNFTDILSAGGHFVTGGYNGTIDSGDDNPLDGRAVWTSNSKGWITTAVNLPPSAAGQNVVLRWGCGTDSGNDDLTGAGYWYIDSISLMDGYYTCCTSLVATALSRSQINNGNFVFSFPTVANQSYTIEYKNSLTDPTWTIIGSVAGDGSLQTITNSANASERFYRVSSP